MDRHENEAWRFCSSTYYNKVIMEPRNVPGKQEEDQCLSVERTTRAAPFETCTASRGKTAPWSPCHRSCRRGFPQVQVATNGIRLATEDGFFDKVAEAGLNTIYLQFDGLREENYIKARGRPLLDVKLKVIERVRERKGKNLPTPAICFVPTMVNSFNDDQAGEILNYAIKN